MSLDVEFEASFVRIIGLMGFILATVAFFLMMSGMTGAEGEQDADDVMFVAFVMCTALAFAGLIISTLAQMLSTLQNIEKLLEGQSKPIKKTPAKKTTTKKKKTT